MTEDSLPPKGQDEPFQSAFPADGADDGGLDSPAIPRLEPNKIRGTLGDFAPAEPGTSPDASDDEEAEGAAWVNQKASEIEARMANDPGAEESDQEQWWQQPEVRKQSDANNATEAADDGLDEPAAPRDRLQSSLITSADVPKNPSAPEQEVNNEGIEEAKRRLADYFSRPSVQELYNTHTARIEKAPEGHDVARAKQILIDHAIEKAKEGELQQVQLLWGIASGNHSMTDNARYALEHVSHSLLGSFDGNFHTLTDMGRGTYVEKVTISEDDNGQGLTRAMALAQDHVITVDYDHGYSHGFLAPVMSEDRKTPTGTWLHITSGAFTNRHYNPMLGEIWNVNLVIPPYGKTPEFTEDMRHMAKARAKKPLDDFAYEVNLSEKDPHYDEAWVEKIEQRTQQRAEELAGYRNNFIAKPLQGEKDEDGTVRPAEQIVHNGAYIQAGSEMFMVRKDNKGDFRLENDSLWQDLHAIGHNLDPELPRAEQKVFKDEANQWITNFLSQPLEMGKPLITGRDFDGPNIKGDTLLSRRHFSVELQQDGSIKISDLGSSNGTILYAKKENYPPELATLPPQPPEASPPPETPAVRLKGSRGGRLTKAFRRNQ